MANIIDPTTPTSIARVDASSSGVHTTLVQRGTAFRLTLSLGVMAAGAAAALKLVSLRLNPSTAVRAYFSSIRVTTIVSTVFTVVPNPGRRLGTCVVNGAAPTAGTAIASPTNSRIGGAASQFASANGGDIRYAAAGLTGGPTVPTSSGFFAFHPLVNGTALTTVQTDLVPEGTQNPIAVNPGDCLMLCNATDLNSTGALLVFDAGGVVGVNVEFFWTETALLI